MTTSALNNLRDYLLDPSRWNASYDFGSAEHAARLQLNEEGLMHGYDASTFREFRWLNSRLTNDGYDAVALMADQMRWDCAMRIIASVGDMPLASVLDVLETLLKSDIDNAIEQATKKAVPAPDGCETPGDAGSFGTGAGSIRGAVGSA